MRQVLAFLSILCISATVGTWADDVTGADRILRGAGNTVQEPGGSEGLILLQGVENGRAFSIVIEEATGLLSRGRRRPGRRCGSADWSDRRRRG